MSKNELVRISQWHEYTENGGSADFEVFYAHTIPNQKLLVKVARGKQKLIKALAMSRMRKQ